MARYDGTAGNDIYNGTALEDLIFGYDGRDQLKGSGGQDQLYGGAGTDFISGGDHDYIFYNTSFSSPPVWIPDLEQDTLDGGAGYDYIVAGYNDFVFGGLDSASLILDYTGMATPFVGTIADGAVIANGSGTISDVNSIRLVLGAGDDEVTSGGAILDRVQGGDGNDVLRGNATTDIFEGEAGQDTLYGNDGNDGLTGGAAQDRLFGGAGDDSLRGGVISSRIDSSPDLLDGGEGYDRIYAGYNDTVIGGADSASLDLDWSNLRMTRFVGAIFDPEDLSNGSGTISGVNSISLTLSDGDDIIRPSGDILDVVYGGGGNDVLYGGDFSVKLFGDRVIAGNASSTYGGGTVSYARSESAIRADLDGLGRDANGNRYTVERDGANGPIRDDASDYSRNNLIATRFDDQIDGANGDFDYDGGEDLLYYLRDGVDRIDGGAGDDVIRGLGGSDRLFGGDGDDSLDGGQQRDMLTGGAGADRFVFQSLRGGSFDYIDADSGGTNMFGSSQPADLITDFNAAEGDRIDLSRFDANGAQNGRQAPIFIGTDGPSGRRGELWYTTVGDDLFIHIDRNGDTVSDFDIRLRGVDVITAQDLIL